VDIAELRGLDSTAEDVCWVVLVPQLDLQDELLERASLHLWLGVLWDRCLVEVLSGQAEDKTVSDSARPSSSLDSRSFRGPVQLEGLTFTRRVIMDFLSEQKIDDILDIRDRD
jgi:hypothetical protein